MAAAEGLQLDAKKDDVGCGMTTKRRQDGLQMVPTILMPAMESTTPAISRDGVVWLCQILTSENGEPILRTSHMHSTVAARPIVNPTALFPEKKSLECRRMHWFLKHCYRTREPDRSRHRPHMQLTGAADRRPPPMEQASAREAGVIGRSQINHGSMYLPGPWGKSRRCH